MSSGGGGSEKDPLVSKDAAAAAASSAAAAASSSPRGSPIGGDGNRSSNLEDTSLIRRDSKSFYFAPLKSRQNTLVRAHTYIHICICIYTYDIVICDYEFFSLSITNATNLFHISCSLSYLIDFYHICAYIYMCVCVWIMYNRILNSQWRNLVPLSIAV